VYLLYFKNQVNKNSIIKWILKKALLIICIGFLDLRVPESYLSGLNFSKKCRNFRVRLRIVYF